MTRKLSVRRSSAYPGWASGSSIRPRPYLDMVVITCRGLPEPRTPRVHRRAEGRVLASGASLRLANWTPPVESALPWHALSRSMSTAMRAGRGSAVGRGGWSGTLSSDACPHPVPASIRLGAPRHAAPWDRTGPGEESNRSQTGGPDIQTVTGDKGLTAIYGMSMCVCESTKVGLASCRNRHPTQ